MTKDEIIELHDNCMYYNHCFGIVYNKDEFLEKLLAKIEQEKKEVAREIIGDLKGLLEGYVHTKDNISLYEYYCKKYGVEL